MDKKFNPYSPDCELKRVEMPGCAPPVLASHEKKKRMSELDASRWLEKQPGMVMTVQKDGRMALFMEGRLFVKGQGILGAVIAAKKIFDNEKLVKTGGCS